MIRPLVIIGLILLFGLALDVGPLERRENKPKIRIVYEAPLIHYKEPE
jgi:hypothetical protein